MRTPIIYPMASASPSMWHVDTDLLQQLSHELSDEGRLSLAYLMLLGMRHGPVRHSPETQAAMANLRDALAVATGHDSETIQNAFEGSMYVSLFRGNA